MLRIGHGFDTHRFEKGKALVLGGVTIPFDRGMEGHSDGDVVIHAICDALLGASGLGDLGHYFPDTDPQYKNIDSRILLQKTSELLIKNNYQINNVDVTVLAQVPKLMSYLREMRVNISSAISISFDQINIKATTTEKMGYVGQEEGIACYAVALLYAER